MTRHHKRRSPGARDSHVWIEAELNDELDARKLSRAFLALALHRASLEAEAQNESGAAAGGADGAHDAGA